MIDDTTTNSVNTGSASAGTQKTLYKREGGCDDSTNGSYFNFKEAQKQQYHDIKCEDDDMIYKSPPCVVNNGSIGARGLKITTKTKSLTE